MNESKIQILSDNINKIENELHIIEQNIKKKENSLNEINIIRTYFEKEIAEVRIFLFNF